MKIKWSEIKEDDSDLCGKCGKIWVDVVQSGSNDERIWSVYIDNKKVEENISSRDEAQNFAQSLCVFIY